MLRSAKYGLYGAVLAGLVGGSALWHSVDKSVTLYVDGTPTRIHTTAASVADVLGDAGYHAGRHDIVAPAPGDSVHDGSTVVFKRGRLLRLSIDGAHREVWTTAPTVADAMAQLGFGATTFTSVSRSRRLPLRATEIDFRTPKTVTIDHDGTAQLVSTTEPTVGALMDNLGIALATTDRVSAQLTTPLTNDMHLVVNRVVNTTTSETKTVKFDTVRHDDSSLLQGTTQIATHGKDGKVRTTYALVYVDGKLTGKTKISTRTLADAVTQVEKIGTQPPPTTYSAASSTSDSSDSSSSSGSSSDSSSGSSSGSGSSISVTPGSAQAIAKAMLADRGWGDDQFGCLVTMWNHESGWRTNAYNPSGAYGIPQALPGSKMASYGSDWQTNPVTQIKWGLAYISSRYGTPCGAWAQWQANGGWYY